MTAPAWPVMTVPLKPCCGAPAGDYCTCACFQTQARIVVALSEPILLPRHADLPVLTDPALEVWRPGPDMVEAMCPPFRWTVTRDTVSVSLGVTW